MGILPDDLALTKQWSADAIVSVERDLIKKINIPLRRSMTGELRPHQAMMEIYKLIGRKGKVGASHYAERIVRTEMTGARNAMHNQNIIVMGDRLDPELQGKLKKTWLGSDDPNTREGHHSSEVESVPYDQPFIVNGEPLMYPGDPAASPWNKINCRCDMRIDISEIQEELGVMV